MFIIYHQKQCLLLNIVNNAVLYGCGVLKGKIVKATAIFLAS